MTVPLGEPTKIGDADVRLGFWGMPRNPGDPRRVAGTFTVVNGEGDLLLDVFIGPKGDPGVPLPVMDVQWDSTVTTIGDLPDVETLNASDNGRAWIIGTTWYVYVHDLGEYRTVDAGIPGPQGITPDIDVTAGLVVTEDENDLTVTVTPSGTTESPNFHLGIPTAPLIGPIGPSTEIRNAPDYDDSTPPNEGQGIVWDESAEKFKPGDLSPTSATIYTLSHSDFIEYSGSAGRQLIATLDIEAQAVAYYVDVIGRVKWGRGLFSTAQVEVEVRIGDTGVGTGETAPLCGLAAFDPAWLDTASIAHIEPQFSDVSNPSRSISPESSEGRVPDGQAKTVYVFLHKIGGSGSYTFTPDYTAQLRVALFPVS